MAKKPIGKNSMSCEIQQNEAQSRKSKISEIRNLFPQCQKDMVVKVLEYYNYDGDKALSSITMDGGVEALYGWNKTRAQNNQILKTNKSKKKNKKKNKKSALNAASPGTDADDSSSLHSSNIDFDDEKEVNVKSVESEEIIIPKPVPEPLETQTELTNSVLSTHCNEDLKSQTEVTENQKNNVSDLNVESTPPPSDPKVHIPSSDTNVREEDKSASSSSKCKESLEKQSKPPYSKHQPYRQRHGSSHHSRSSVVSEDNNFQTSTAPRKGGTDIKCAKDLQRQTVSLQRIQLQLETKLEDASKRLKNAFNEVKKSLDTRQAEVEAEFEKVKHEALELLKSRQQLASELKVRVDRNPSDSEWNDLKTDIKQFVTERKYDEELGKAIWFQWSPDDITKEIGKFGDICPVKVGYSQRQHSFQSGRTTSVESPAAEAEVGVTDEFDPSASIGKESGVEKDVHTKMSSSQGTSHFQRTFSNTKYSQQFHPRYPLNQSHNNKGRVVVRGGHSNYARPRYENNYRQFGGTGGYNDYRPHYTRERNEFRQKIDNRQQMDIRPPHEKQGGGLAPEDAKSMPQKQQHHRGGSQYRRPRSNQRPYSNRPYNSYNSQPRFSKAPHSNADSNVPPESSESRSSDKNANYDNQTTESNPDMINGHI